MTEIDTADEINVGHLAHLLTEAGELGVLGIRSRGPDDAGRRIHSIDASEEAVSTARLLLDDEWTPPLPPMPPTREEMVADLPNPVVDFDGFKAALAEMLSP